MKPHAEPESFRLTIPSQTRYLNLVTGLAKRAANVAGMDDASASKFSIAVDEAVTNVILHAYHGDAEQLVEIELCFAPEELVVHIWHAGDGLAEGQVALPDPSEYVKHPRKGGLGLLLMSRFMDAVHFSEAPGRSECCMVKRVS
ncbi:MAG TPA: ATP-binding protein [Holophaga sp.]|nr:ATP-binding protein [Holophaga sp.]